MNRISINRHAEWQQSLRHKGALSSAPVEIHGLLSDDDFDDLLEIDPYAGDPPSKRSDKELARILSVLDSLDERGNG